MSETAAEYVVIEIAKIDLKPDFRGSSISGKDKSGKEFLLVFRPDTMIRKMTPLEVTRQLGEFLGDSPSSLPFRVGQEVLVAWKLDPRSSQKVAIKITVFE